MTIRSADNIWHVVLAIAVGVVLALALNGLARLLGY